MTESKVEKKVEKVVAKKTTVKEVKPAKKVEAKVEVKTVKKVAVKEVKPVKKVEAKVAPKVEAKPVVKTVATKEVEAKVEVKPVVKAKKVVRRRKTSNKPKIKLVQVKAKRKTAIARAVIKAGKGRVTINKSPYTIISNKFLKNMIREPLLLTDEYDVNMTKKVDIEVSVAGGGQVSQIVASRGCIAKGLYKYYEDDKLKDIFNKYDSALLIDDVRRKEAKKQLGRGARSKKQQSKR